MSEGMVFCRYCGKQIAAGAAFCKHCGKKLVRKEPENVETTPVMQSVEQVRFTEPQVIPEPQPGIEQQPQLATLPQVPVQARTQQPSQPRRTWAAKQTGEIEAGSFSVSEGNEDSNMAPTQPATEIKAPMAGLLNAVASFFGGIPKTFGNKKALLFAILMTGVYFVWGILKAKLGDNPLLGAISGLTLADSGTTGGVLGVLSGLIGKGTAAAALYTIFNGNIKSLPNGLKSLFGNGSYTGKSEPGGMLIGAGAALLISAAISGGSPSGAPLAGVFAAVLSLEALGGREGQIYRLVQSFTSKQLSGFRAERETKLKGVLAGSAIGFAASTVLSALGTLKVILGILLILGGTVFSVVAGKKGGEA